MMSSTESTVDLWVQERYKDATSVGFRVQQVLHSSHSEFQRLDVLETASMGRLMLLDGMVMTTDADEFIYHELISHVPLCSLPQPPQRVLIIGGGDGGTLREVLRHPSVSEAVLCEIDGAVVQAARDYFPTLATGLDDPRTVLAIEDGVAYMRNAPDDYFDLIIIDSTDPIGPGVGLFTEAFYSQAKRALAPRGILTAQTESPLAEAEGMARIYKVLHSVFPQVGAFFGTVPTYPGALWSWAYCTKTAEQAGGPHPLNTFNMAAAHALTPQLRYYNAAVHQAVFALPNFVQALVQPTLAV
jgi:spermidine synthase